MSSLSRVFGVQAPAPIRCGLTTTWWSRPATDLPGWPPRARATAWHRAGKLEATLPLDFDHWPVAHAFRSGHRIRLQVSGGAHPRYGRDLGIADQLATSTRLEASDRTVFHDAQHPRRCGYPYRADH